MLHKPPSKRIKKVQRRGPGKAAELACGHVKTVASTRSSTFKALVTWCKHHKSHKKIKKSKGGMTHWKRPESRHIRYKSACLVKQRASVLGNAAYN